MVYLIRVAFILTFFLILAPFSSYASEKEGGGLRSEQSSHHPPHDHHDNDHLKYIRGHGNERKKKVLTK